MSIVTLTTDFGQKDYYGARIKGAVLSRTPQSVLVDITHFVPCYNIVQAAFIFKNAWESFPEGTIHLLTVNDLDDAACRKKPVLHESRLQRDHVAQTWCTTYRRGRTMARRAMTGR